MPYVLRSAEIEVFHYTRQPREEWPSWLLEADGFNEFGKVNATIDAVGILMVPTAKGVEKVTPGGYAVLQAGKISTYTVREFDDKFDWIDE